MLQDAPMYSYIPVLRQKRIRLQALLNQCVWAGSTAMLMAVDQATTLAGPGWTTPRFLDSGEWCSQRYWLTCRRAPHRSSPHRFRID
jgi:hypothetical protein